ncbi:MAG TPA: 30S ribosomal protein S1 [bacterium]|jgi:small subunit ribosomal protein S1|nr:30S ribosomal protein S1 [bacterium]
MADSPIPEMTMEELLNEEKRVARGQVVTGEIVKIGEDELVIDVGYKTEGVIPRTEFQDITGELTVKVGDKVEVSVERMADSNGRLRLSKRNVDKSRVWQNLEEVHNSGGLIKGRVTKKVNGGYRVDLGVVEAFLPASQISLHKNPEAGGDHLEKLYDFKIIKIDRNRSNVVVSRRPVLEVERSENRHKRLNELNPGDVIEGRVKSLVSYGAFVDLGGVDGLLHIADIDWGRVNKVEDFVKPDAPVKVMVLQVDKDKGKISLGIKQMLTDPWTEADKRYRVGDVIEVEVTHFADYGVFLKMADNLEGFCHVTEISWSKKLKKPSEFFKVGEKRRAQLIELDFEKRKISFSFKRLEKSPWENVSQRHPIGSNIQATVTNIADFGLFMEIEDGLEGLLHQSDITWDKRTKAPQKEFKVGQTLSVKLLAIDQEKKRISLGLKQVEGDPWDKIEEKYKPGQVMTGKVQRLAEFGAFIELEKNVEGLVHKTEIASPVPKKVEDALKPGDEVTVKVLSIDSGKRRIALSIKALTKKSDGPQEEEVSEEDSVHRKTNAFQKMLKKFLKKSKTEEEEVESDF